MVATSAFRNRSYQILRPIKGHLWGRVNERRDRNLSDHDRRAYFAGRAWQPPSRSVRQRGFRYRQVLWRPAGGSKLPFSRTPAELVIEMPRSAEIAKLGNRHRDPDGKSQTSYQSRRQTRDRLRHQLACRARLRSSQALRPARRETVFSQFDPSRLTPAQRELAKRVMMG